MTIMLELGYAGCGHLWLDEVEFAARLRSLSLARCFGVTDKSAAMLD